MTWLGLRPLLRDKFRYGWYFYNDARKTHERRIKIVVSNNFKSIMFDYINHIAPNLNTYYFGDSCIIIKF